MKNADQRRRITSESEELKWSEEWRERKEGNGRNERLRGEEGEAVR